MRLTTIISMIAGAMVLVSCGNKAQTVNFVADDCDITLGNVNFTKAINLDKAELTASQDSLRMTAQPGTDYFRSPSDGSVIATSPIIFTEVDNTKPFTFTAKVQPDYTPEGTYSAGTIYAYVDETFWQKFAYEQDEAGRHRAVTVRTMETSDDNNHQALDSKAIYLRFSSDTKAFGCYYSEDGKTWNMVKLYKNNYPAKLHLGIGTQSPSKDSHSCLFSEVDLQPVAVNNFREGAL